MKKAKSFLLLLLLSCQIAQASWLFFPSPVSSWSNAHSLNLGNSNSTKYFTVGTAFNYARTQALTISCWVKLAGSGAYQKVFDNQGTPSYTGYWFGFSSADKVRFQIYNGANSTILDQSSSESISTGAWHHYAVSYDGTSSGAGVAMYRDGVLLTNVNNGQNLSGTTSNSVTASIGRATDGTSFLQGSIDEVAIFDAALSSGAIASIYNSGVPTDISASSNLVSYYRMETGLSPADSSTTIYDRKSSNNGTGVNLSSGDFSTSVP